MKGHCLATSIPPRGWARRQWQAPFNSSALGYLMVMCWQDWWWQHCLSAPLGGMCHQLFTSMWNSKSHGMVLLWLGGGHLCWDSPPHPVKDLGPTELGFLAFCRASLSQGLEIHHGLYNYLSFPSCRSSVLYRARNVCKMEGKKVQQEC